MAAVTRPQRPGTRPALRGSPRTPHQAEAQAGWPLRPVRPYRAALPAFPLPEPGKRTARPKLRADTEDHRLLPRDDIEGPQKPGDSRYPRNHAPYRARARPGVG